MIYFYLVIVFVVGYFLGNINFARIFSKVFGKKDITQLGSKNPGTMNVLRTQGFGRAILTLVCEAAKVGAPALACFFMFQHLFGHGFGNLAYFALCFGAILGYCYPVFYKFKGGKGIACTFGMFLFHPDFWWMSLAMFAFCFILFFFVKYGFIISLTFILALNIFATCVFALNEVMWFIALIVVFWFIFAVVIFQHRSNIKRLINGTENKVDFKHYFAKIFKKKPKTAGAAVATEAVEAATEEAAVSQQQTQQQAAQEEEKSEN